jgi:RNA polymerase sigma-70 factor (ECF subfamily)
MYRVRLWRRNRRMKGPQHRDGFWGEGQTVSSGLEWGLCLVCLGGLFLALLVVPSLRRGSGGSVPQFIRPEDPQLESAPGRGEFRSPVFFSAYGATGAVIARDDSGLSVEGADLPDAVLVEGARRGEDRAFEMLVRRYLRPAHTVAVSIVKSPDLADDVCQDAFLSALRHLEQCRYPDRFKGWLFTIVRNRALNLKASEVLRSGAPLETSGQFASSDDPERDLEQREVMENLEEAVGELSGLNQEVFILHDLEGWGHAEISRKLGISNISSRVHLHHARQRLKVLLDGNAMTEV